MRCGPPGGSSARLFTKYPIQACDFVGFFVGSWYSDTTYEDLIEDEKDQPRPRPFPKYSIRSGDEEIGGRIVNLTCVPDIREGATEPDPDRSMLFYSNEPSEGDRANCVLKELVLEEDELDGVPPNNSGGPFIAFALIATEAIERESELTWHYGRKYNRQGYRAGAPATASCDEFNIRDHYTGGVPVRAVSDYVPTSADDSSQSSGGDREYTEAAFSRLSL